MTVYVDDMYRFPMGQFKRGPRTYKMSHMIATTEAELHAMADKIGVDRRWFQKKASGDHYDITMTKRALAVKAGAVEITMYQCAAMCALVTRFGRAMPHPLVAEEQLMIAKKDQRDEIASYKGDTNEHHTGTT